MENWDVCCATCSATPSWCEASTPAFPNPLGILSNGSQFLYFLDFRRKKQYAVLKFSSGVVYVSNMHSRDEMDGCVVMCCLASGEIAVFSVTNIIKLVRERAEVGKNVTSASTLTEDLFASLFGDLSQPAPTTTRRARAFSAEEVTVGIGMCPPALEWELVSAVVLNNAMVMCRRCCTTGETSHVVLKSNRTIQVPSGGRETIMVPSFVGPRQQMHSSVVVTSVGREGDLVKGSQSVGRRPVFCLLQSESHTPRRHSVITSELFTCLFGLEFELSKTPTLLIGCQNGNIYFTNFRSNQDDSQNMLCPLHSLEQPIIGIHSTYFPARKRTDDDEKDPFVIQEETDWRDSYHMASETHNAIIFLGLRGRIAICYVTPSHQQPSLRFIEFNVPAPIISSMLLQDRCLIYSTLQGLYRICLRQKCAKSVEESVPSLKSKLPIVIPEVSFKFPEKVFDLNCACYLLQSDTGGLLGAESGGLECEFEPESCLCITLSGRLTVFKFEPHGVHKATSRRSSSQVGQEIKSCLQMIQAQGEKVDRVMEEIRSLNAILAELKSALDILCSVGQAAGIRNLLDRHGPAFSCSFQCAREEVGTSAERLSVVVKVTRNTSSSGCGKGVALRKGWSLIVDSVVRGRAVSNSVPITGLVCGDSVTLKVDAAMCGHTGQLGGAVYCFIHYDPHHLCESLERSSSKKSLPFNGISLFLARKDFDILDYLQSLSRGGVVRLTLSSLQLGEIKSILAPNGDSNTCKQSPPSLLHSTPATITLRTAVSIIHSSTSSSVEELQESDVGTISTNLLRVLLPAIDIKPNVILPREQPPEIFTCLDGEGVSFKVSCTTETASCKVKDCRPGAELKLVVRTSSKNCLAEIVSAVNKRRLKVKPESVPVSHEEACVSLQRLRQLLKEVGELEREMSASWQERRTNCISPEAYRKALDSWRAKTLALYCRLRE